MRTRLTIKRISSLLIALAVWTSLVLSVAILGVQARKSEVPFNHDRANSKAFVDKLISLSTHAPFDYSPSPDQLSVTAAFTPGNIVVCRVGSGAALTSNATAAFIDEFTPAGTLVQSIALPTAVSGPNQILTVSGLSTSECQITRSADGRYVMVPGYNIAVGGAVGAGQRTIGRLDNIGTVDTSTIITTGFTSFRGATSSNGTDIWAVGSTTGVVYTTFNTSSAGTVVSTTITNNRVTNIFNGQLYSSDASGTAIRLGTVGTGLPTTTGQTITNLPGFLTNTGSPYSFFFADLTQTVAGVDTLYVADDTPGTILKYSLVGGTWTANGTIAATAIRGLTGTVTGSSVRLFGTTGASAAAGGGSLYTLLDTSGYNATITGSLSTIATAAANTVFRGVALAPTFKFRSLATGNWNSNSTWEMSADGVTWVAATTTPTASNADTITVRSPHTVTVTAAVNADQLTVDAGASLAASSTLTNDGTTTINGSFQLNDGGIATGNEFVYGATGTLIYNHTGPAYNVGFVDTAWPFSNGPFNVTLQNGGGVNLNDFRDVNGTLSLLNGSLGNAFNLNMGNGATIVRRAAGSFSGGSPGFGTTVNVIYDGTVALTTGVEIPASSSILQALTITNTGGVTLGASITANGITTIAAGASLRTGAFTFTNSGTATVNGTFQIDQGGFANGNNFSYDPVTGTLIFNNSSGSFAVSGSPVYWPAVNGPQNVIVQNSGGITVNVPRTVGISFRYAAGVSNMSNLTLNGLSQVNAGGFTSGSPTYGPLALLKYNTGGTYGRNGEWLPGAIGGPGYPHHVQLSNNTTLDLVNSSNAPFQMAGDLTIDAGSTMQLSLSALTNPLTIFGSVNNNGIFNLSNLAGGDVNVGGNWNNNGTFNNNGRTVNLIGSIGQAISGNSNFFNLTKSTATAQTLTFAALSTQTVTNSLTLNGASGNLLSLRSSTPGTQWKLNVLGTSSVSFVDVQDSDASGGTAIAPTSSVNSGNNINWTFATADYTVTTTGNAIVVTDVSGNGETVTVSEPAAGQIKFAASPAGRFFSVDGGAPIPNDSGNIPLLGTVTSITVNAAAGNDTINVTSFTTSLPNFTVNGGTGDDTINFNGNITFATNANLDVDLQNDDPTPGIDQVLFNSGVNVVLSGTGTATVKVSRNITFNSAATLRVVNGNMTLEANQQLSATAGNFRGILVGGATLTTQGTGNISLKGKGGTDAATSNHQGIFVTSGSSSSLINSTSAAAGAGTITLDGTGGTGTTAGRGIDVISPNASITSVTGDISFIGHGGTGGTTNYGVSIQNGPVVSSTGAAKITMNGTGGSGTSGQTGSRVSGDNTQVNSAGGDISITGQGGSGTTGSHGVSLALGAAINATNSANIVVNGTGGSGSDSNVGVVVSSRGPTTLVGAKVTATTGSIQFTGQGGPGTGIGNIGWNIDSGASVTGPNISINATGGSGSSDCYGVGFEGANIAGTGISTPPGGGTITITGTGGPSAGTDMDGVRFEDSVAAQAVSLTTLGTSSLSITGTAGNTDPTSAGINIVDDCNMSLSGATNTFIADTMDFGTSNVSINAGSNALTLRQKTNGKAINLGGADSATNLGLTDTELDLITAGTLNFGDANSGALTVSGAITRSSMTTINPTSGANIDIQAGGSIQTLGGNFNPVPATNFFPAQAGVEVSTGAGTTTLATAKDLKIVINNLTVDSGYTQLNLVGLVNLNNANLFVSGTHTPSVGEQFIIVNNDSNDPVVGTFNGLPQGAVSPSFLGSALWSKISYVGGDGNDVVLTVVSPTASSSVITGQILDAGGAPVPGVAVHLDGTQHRLTVSDSRGNYRFENVDTGGFYTVTPARLNYVFSPSARSFSQLGESTNATFVATSTGTGLNPLDTTEYFVRQQYLDFLGREPDEVGLTFWVNNIESCGPDFNCRAAKREDTSAAFFLSIEFHETGYLVYRAYQSAYGDMPGAPVPLTLAEFKPDKDLIGKDVIVNAPGWQEKLAANKSAFMKEFVSRPRFATAYPVTLTPAEFVDRLFATAGVVPEATERNAVIALFGTAVNSADVTVRARALQRVAENGSLDERETNSAFVLMEYYGYLDRDPNAQPDSDFSGYHFWLQKLNDFNGDYRRAEMVKAFLVAGEYRDRFVR